MTGFSVVLIGSFQKVYSEISEWMEGTENCRTLRFTTQEFEEE